MGNAELGRMAYQNGNERDKALAALRLAKASLAVLARIADAYDDNGLDDEARKRWGEFEEYTSILRPDQIELYAGRGGKQLLTLADCFAAREALKGIES